MRIYAFLVLIYFISPALGKAKCTMRLRSITGKVYEIYLPFASLGRTLDKNNERLGFSDIPEKLIKANTQMIRTRYGSTSYKIIRTEKDAEDILGVGGALSLKLQVGDKIDVNGPGKYMKNPGDRSSYAELMFISSVTNGYAILENIETLVTTDMCKSYQEQGMTHIVTGFEYGGVCIISVKATVNNNEKKRDMEAEIKASLQDNKVRKEPGGNSKMKLPNMRHKNVTVTTFCNAKLQTVATSMVEAVMLAKNSTKMLHKEKGDGVPIKMELTPLEYFPQCKEVKRYKSGQLIDTYLQSVNSMLNDAKAALSRLEKCVKAYRLITESTQALKTRVMTTFRTLRKVDYDLKLAIRKIDLSKDIKQFFYLEKKYTGGAKEKPWNYRYWTEIVIKTCKSMRKFSFPPREKVACSLSESPAVLSCGFKNVVSKATGSPSSSSHEAEQTLHGKCFVNDGPFRLFYLLDGDGVLKNVTLMFQQIEAAGNDTNYDLAGTSVYLSGNSKSYGDYKDDQTFEMLAKFDEPLSPSENSTSLIKTIDIPHKLETTNKVLMVAGTDPNKKIRVCGVSLMASVCSWVAA